MCRTFADITTSNGDFRVGRIQKHQQGLLPFQSPAFLRDQETPMGTHGLRTAWFLCAPSLTFVVNRSNAWDGGSALLGTKGISCVLTLEFRLLRFSNIKADHVYIIYGENTYIERETGRGSVHICAYEFSEVSEKIN